MKSILYIFIFFTVGTIFSQEKPNFEAVDSLYREDQFYIGVTYNSLQSRSTGISQKKFTPSFSLGFLRDIPINKRRTFAIAAGLGYSINNYNENLLISENNSIISYQGINSTTVYEKNKLLLHYVDLPIEFRWRTSTPESHKFYRIYTGFKLSYLVYDRSKYIDYQSNIKIANNPDFNKLMYGAYLSAGYNTWNAYVYYGLTPTFKSGILNNKDLQMKTINFGLMFYIL